MPISTIQPQNNNIENIKKASLYVLGAALVGAAVFLGGTLLKNIPSLQGKATLTADVLEGSAEVTLNGKFLGNTPLDNTPVKPGENKITIKNATGQYDTSVEFLPNSQVVIKRDLGVSQMFSSGQTFWIEKNKSGTVANIISDPTNAYVYIDGTEVGKTPYSSNSLSEGEYDLRVEYPGYESQAARIKVQNGYGLNVSLKLFPIPVPDRVALLEGSSSLYNTSLDNSIITADTLSWVKAAVYWNKTRGVNLAESGLNKDLVFDYFIDYKGNIYNKDGNIITTQAEYDSIKDAKRGGYLGKAADGAVLSTEAKEALATLSTVVSAGKMATIKQTPTGWLRVRSDSSLDGTEIARVNVGGKYSVLEQQTGWVKIKVSDTITGWVSADFVEVSE